MTNRTVFKIFGSLGPAGAFATMTEKICRKIFPEAYELGDPTRLVSKEEEEMKVLRSAFVNELFNYKSQFERDSISLKKERRVQAYAHLGKILESHKVKMIKVEKNRLNRERIFSKNEGNEVKAQ